MNTTQFVIAVVIIALLVLALSIIIHRLPDSGQKSGEKVPKPVGHPFDKVPKHKPDEDDKSA